MKKLYEKFDGTVMNAVNGGVRAWNWITGRTKADLANSMVSYASVACSTGLILENPIFGAIISPIILLMTHTAQKHNLEIEQREVIAKNRECLDLWAEEEKERMRRFTPFSIGLQATTFLPMPPTEISVAITQTGYTFLNASFYVMRADNFPRRKNCLVRGLKRLDELVCSAGEKIAPYVRNPSLNYERI